MNFNIFDMPERLYIACCSAFDGTASFSSLSAAQAHIKSVREKFPEFEFKYWIEVYQHIGDGKYLFSYKRI